MALKVSSVALLLLICAYSAASAAASAADPTVYEILRSYNFPVGILPKGATGYDFDTATGKFSVYFDGTCSFSIQGSYQLRYQSTISGRISQNRLLDLSGISVKVLLFWVNIVEVERSGDNLEFSVGIASAEFPVNNFDECPQCGCGMNCGNGGQMTIGGESRLRLRGSF